jgi:hypothetical protein
MECDAVREQLEEYVLGVLDRETQLSIAQHLSGCDACRRLLDESADALATLPTALAAVSPHALPDKVKTRLLATVTSGSAPSTGLLQSEERPAARRLAPRPVVPAGGQPTMRPTTARNANLRSLRLALIAASLLLVLAIAWSIRLNVVLARERALRAEYMDLVGQQQELVLEVVDSSDTTRRVLRPPAGDSRAYGKLFTRTGLTHVVAMAARLPPPPPGQAYHLWLTSGGQTELAGVLAVNSAGFGLLIHEAQTDQPTYAAAEVTLQPAGSTTLGGESILIWRAADD